MVKYLKIIGGTEKDAEDKFPWLKPASFQNAIIDIRLEFLVWKDGTWKDGTWLNGIWENGTWKGGTWIKGIWIKGTLSKDVLKNKKMIMEAKNGI